MQKMSSSHMPATSFSPQVQITTENVLQFYESAMKKRDGLLHRCRWFVCQNAKSILQSEEFIEASPTVVIDIVKQSNLCVDNEMEVIDAVMQWGAERCRRECFPSDGSYIRNFIIPMLEYIRFLTLTVTEFMDFVDKYDVLISGEIQSITHKILEPDSEVKLCKGLCTITQKRNTKPKAVERRSESTWSQISKTKGPQTYGGRGPELNGHKTSQINVGDIVHIPHKSKKTSSDVKNNEDSNQNPPICPTSKLTHQFPLIEVGKEIENSFPRSIISTVDLKAKERKSLIHGLVLSIKPKCPNEKIDVLFSTSNDSNEEEEFYSEKITNDNNLYLNLSRPLVLSPKSTATIQVLIDGLLPQRCFICRNQRFALNNGNDKILELSIKSNMKHDQNSFPFLISRMVYSFD